jgi:hypothetical protein
MYELNKQAKIIINEKEIYLGSVTEIDTKNKILKLYVVDWHEKNQSKYYTILAPMEATVIKYNIEVNE